MELATAVEETGSTTEELARSIRGVAEQAKQVETSGASSATNVTSVAAAVEEVAATAEKSAVTVDGTAAAIEQIARSATAMTKSAEHITQLAATSAETAADLEVSTRGIARSVHRRGARRRPSASRRVAREGGATGDEVDHGLRPDAPVDLGVGGGHERDGAARRGDRRHRGDDQPDRRPHEPAESQREHRSGAGGRARARLRGRRGGDPGALGSRGRGERGHREDRARAPEHGARRLDRGRATARVADEGGALAVDAERALSAILERRRRGDDGTVARSVSSGDRGAALGDAGAR